MDKTSKSVCHLSTVHIRDDVRVFYKECISLAKAGYKVHLIVADGKGHEYKSGVAIQDLGHFSSRLTRMLIAPVKLLFAAMAKGSDIYHFHDPELLPVGLLLKLVTRAKVVYDAHECYKDDILHKNYLPKWSRWLMSETISRLESFVTRRLDAVVTVTDHHAKRFIAINPHTYVVCNYPLKNEWATALSEDQDKQPASVCYVGNITEKRGITQLLKALESIDCTLHLAGAYEPSTYRDELTKLPAWAKVKEYGYINRNEAVNLISSSLLGVMLFKPEPNHINSLSTKVFEYMAGATCVLVSDFPVYNSTIQQQGCGVCVNPEDVSAISNAISGLLLDPQDAIRMGQAGRKLVQDNYSWESQQNTLLNAYQSLFETNRGK